MKYPRLPDELNRSRKLTTDDVATIKEHAKLGASIKELAAHYGVTYGAIYYHLQPEHVKRARTQASHENAKRLELEDPERKIKRTRQQYESIKYRRKVNRDFVAYKNELWRNYSKRRKQEKLTPNHQD